MITLKSLLAALLLLPCTLQLATAQETPKTTEFQIKLNALLPNGCVGSVIAGWGTAAKIRIDLDARAILMTTTDTGVRQLKKPGYMQDDQWFNMLETLTSGGYRAAQAAVGISLKDTLYFGVAVAYEADGTWKCTTMASTHFPKETAVSDLIAEDSAE